MTELQWARLKVEGPYPLRRGAWYRITTFTADRVVLDVNRQAIPVPRSLLELVTTLPQTWTVVPRPRGAVRLPASWGDRYAVCPSCRHRAPLEGSPRTLRCPRCNGLFPLA